MSTFNLVIKKKVIKNIFYIFYLFEHYVVKGMELSSTYMLRNNNIQHNI